MPLVSLEAYCGKLDLPLEQAIGDTIWGGPDVWLLKLFRAGLGFKPTHPVDMQHIVLAARPNTTRW